MNSRLAAPWWLCIVLALGLGLWGCPADEGDDDASDDDVGDDDVGDDDTAPDPESDLDDDGLTLAEEEELGTDPDNADSDADGWEDGLEVDENFDPMDADDTPYVGFYGGRDDCYDDFAMAAYSPGDIASDFVGVDQFGDEVHLRDFCGRAAYLEFGADW